MPSYQYCSTWVKCTLALSESGLKNITAHKSTIMLNITASENGLGSIFRKTRSNLSENDIQKLELER